jgi:hypothetical protein
MGSRRDDGAQDGHPARPGLVVNAAEVVAAPVVHTRTSDKEFDSWATHLEVWCG